MMNQCEDHKAISSNVADFLSNVNSVNEESITDYLLWQWRSVDKTFKTINVSSFTKQHESKVSGADFEMELWVIGQKNYYSLVFQAKKLMKTYNSYVNKLNYPNNTGKQLKKLLHYAKTNNKIPFYAFYSLPDISIKTMCYKNVNRTGVFMAHAKEVQKFANKSYGNKVSKHQLLAKSNPFHCMFCCPLTKGSLFRTPFNYTPQPYFKNYFPDKDNIYSTDTLPEYVRYLLQADNDKLNEHKISSLIDQYELRRFRHIAVADMRQMDDNNNQKDFN